MRSAGARGQGVARVVGPMLMVLALVVAATATAPPAAAAAVDQTTFRHRTVAGATVMITECTVTRVWVHAGITRQGPRVHYTRVLVDNCTREESAVSGRATPTVFRVSGTRPDRPADGDDPRD